MGDHFPRLGLIKAYEKGSCCGIFQFAHIDNFSSALKTKNPPIYFWVFTPFLESFQCVLSIVVLFILTSAGLSGLSHLESSEWTLRNLTESVIFLSTNWKVIQHSGVAL